MKTQVVRQRSTAYEPMKSKQLTRITCTLKKCVGNCHFEGEGFSTAASA
jgi:hypothetical protein